MKDVQEMIEILDLELEHTGRSFFSAIEANKILIKAGFLNDTPSDPGHELRRLLSKGAMPHAYQVEGPGSQWVIPHSSARRTLDKPYTQYPLEDPNKKMEP